MNQPIRSMTGFGRAEAESPRYRVRAELKSLNGKFLDLDLRMPRVLAELEPQVRKEAGAVIERGSAQLYIGIEYKPESATNIRVRVNTPLALAYRESLLDLSAATGLEATDLFNTILKMPDVVGGTDQVVDEELRGAVLQALASALAKFAEFRAEEGRGIGELLNACSVKIRSVLAEIEQHEEPRRSQVREKLTSQLENNALTKPVDQNRLEQELIYYFEKLDIAEEKSRLLQHCRYFEECLQKEPSGKKLGFISQEMGREANTLGVKANYFPIQQLVVQIKEEIEKIKEQTLNIV